MVLATAIVLASAAVGAAVRGAATPGQLDASFGQGGHAVVQLNPGCLQSCPEFKGSYADALTLQADGKILLGGWETPGPGPGQPRAILARLDQNGTLDQSFAISGPTARATFEINHVYLLHDGRVLAVGEAEDGKIVLARYTASGEPERSFGSNGVRFLETPPGTSQETLDAAGRIVVLSGSDQRIVVMRFLSSGKLDTSFGAGGFSRLPKMPGAKPIAMVVLKHGGAVVAGATNWQSPERSRLFLARLTATGKLVPSFGPRGLVTVPIARPDISGALTVVSGERIVFATGENPGPGGKLVLLRYTRLGRLDRSFGLSGITRLGIPGVEHQYGSVNARAITLDSNGDVIVVGERHINRVDSPAGIGFLARYTPGGRDCSFGTGGVVSDPDVSSAAAVALEPDGRIVIAGWSKKAFVAARYFGGGTPRTCPGESL